MSFWAILDVIQRELLLFAAFGFLLGGIDEVLVDLIWAGRSAWRRLTVYSRHTRATLQTMTQFQADELPGKIAIVIPLWDEADVIGPMLAHATRAAPQANVRFLIGCYPNDKATISAVKAAATIDRRISIALVGTDGPTTKADCLNAIWAHLKRLEPGVSGGFRLIVLHDAEDVIHYGEIPLFSALSNRFDYMQIPVEPLADNRSRWIAGHYCDEFAEAHSKALIVREALGAGLPAAGVGCAFSTNLIETMARKSNGRPFQDASLTEDYEMGIMAKDLGARAAFVRMPVVKGGKPVSVRAHFPASLNAAVRQKSRWIAGIALAGWDNLGWSGNLAERWMRARDRKAPLEAIVLLAAYLAIIIVGGRTLAAAFWPTPAFQPDALLSDLLLACGWLLVWRLAMRAFFVGRLYGLAEAILCIPRAIVANIITIMAARRAVAIYIRQMRSGKVVWDKTTHQFPSQTGVVD